MHRNWNPHRGSSVREHMHKTRQGHMHELYHTTLHVQPDRQTLRVLCPAPPPLTNLPCTVLHGKLNYSHRPIHTVSRRLRSPVCRIFGEFCLVPQWCAKSQAHRRQPHQIKLHANGALTPALGLARRHSECVCFAIQAASSAAEVVPVSYTHLTLPTTPYV